MFISFIASAVDVLICDTSNNSNELGKQCLSLLSLLSVKSLTSVFSLEWKVYRAGSLPY